MRSPVQIWVAAPTFETQNITFWVFFYFVFVFLRQIGVPSVDCIRTLEAENYSKNYSFACKKYHQLIKLAVFFAYEWIILQKFPHQVRILSGTYERPLQAEGPFYRG